MSSDIEIINDECQQIMLEVKGQSIEIDIDDKMRDVFATMLFDMGRADHKEALQKLVSHLQHQLEVHSGEPGLSYDPLEIDQGWEPPYRNKNACFEQKLAKEIGEMSDEAVEVAVKKYFVKNPCNEIEIGRMNDRQGHPEPEDCWLYYCVSLKEEYRTEEGQIRIHPPLPIEGVVSADLTDPDVFCVVHGTGSMARMLQEHKGFYEKKEYANEFAEFMFGFAQQNLERRK